MTWKKGESGNPSGRPKMPEDVRAIRQATRDDICRCWDWLMRLDYKEWNKIKKDRDKLPVFVQGIIKSLDKYKQTGNMNDIKYILDQVIGKATQPVEVGGEPITFIIPPELFRGPDDGNKQ